MNRLQFFAESDSASLPPETDKRNDLKKLYFRKLDFQSANIAQGKYGIYHQALAKITNGDNSKIQP